MKELDEILSGTAPVQEEPVASADPAKEPETREPGAPAEPEKAEQPRGLDGKFAPKEAAEEEEPKEDGEGKPRAVPQKALHAEREKRRSAEDEAAALRRELAELRGKVDGMSQPRKPEAEPPKRKDFWEDPDGYTSERLTTALTPLQQEQLADRLYYSHRAAVTEFGADTVEQAQQALKDAVAAGQVDGNSVAAKLTKARDPIREIVQWHKNTPAVRETELRERIRAELMEELGGKKPSEEQPKAQPSTLPSDLAGARNVGTRSGPAWPGPAPLNDIFDRSRAKAG